MVGHAAGRREERVPRPREYLTGTYKCYKETTTEISPLQFWKQAHFSFLAALANSWEAGDWCGDWCGGRLRRGRL